MTLDPMTLIMIAVLVLLIFFMFRNNRKRQNDQRELQTKMVPGVRVMTNFGLYGTLISIDDTENIAVVEVLSGARLELHRQTLARVVEPPLDEIADEPDADAQSGEPKYGERSSDDN